MAVHTFPRRRMKSRKCKRIAGRLADSSESGSRQQLSEGFGRISLPLSLSPPFAVSDIPLAFRARARAAQMRVATLLPYLRYLSPTRTLLVAPQD